MWGIEREREREEDVNFSPRILAGTFGRKERVLMFQKRRLWSESG